jgi:TP901 family phage tail tape measure protein
LEQKEEVMQTIEAKAILSASDKTGGIFSQIAAKIRGLNATAAHANRTAATTANIAATASRQGAAANAALVGAAGRVLAPAALAAGAAKAYKNFADSDLQIRRIGITADASEKEVEGLSKNMRDLASTTGQSFGQVTKGLESLVAGGLDLKDALPAMPAIAKTAQAAGAEVEDMATTTLALNQNLKIGTDQMQNAFDILVKGGKAGKFELKDMARYIPSIAPAAVAVGMKGEEGLMRLVAALQTVRNGTGTTEEAADSMLNIFAKMESEETTKKFKKFGIDLRSEMTKARKEGKDLLEVFIDLSDKAIGGDLSKVPQLFSDMQFARGMRALLSYRDLNKKVMDELRTSAGSTQKDFEKVMNTPAIAMKRMSEATDRFVNSVGYGLDKLSKKMGGGDKKGLTSGLNAAADKIQEIADQGLGPTFKGMFDEQADVGRQNEILELEASLARRQALVEKARQRGSEIPAHRMEQMTKDAIRLFELQQLPTVGTAAQPFSEEEIEKWRETPLPKGSFPLPMGDPRKRPGYAPLPSADPRKKGYGSEMPPVQPLDDVVSAIKGMDVKAELTGSAEVKGETEVKVVVEAGSELLRIVDNVKNSIANLAGRLTANGPGSTGKSSPDAKPSSLNTGMPLP